MTSSIRRRDFARLFAAGGSAALFGHPALAAVRDATAAALPAAPLRRHGAPDWEAIRARSYDT